MADAEIHPIADVIVGMEELFVSKVGPLWHFPCFACPHLGTLFPNPSFLIVIWWHPRMPNIASFFLVHRTTFAFVFSK